MAEDTSAQLKADLLAADPGVVTAVLHNKIDEFLEASFKYAHLWQHSEDPWAGLHCLTEALIWLREAQGRLERDIAASQKPKSTVNAFRR